MIFTDKYGKQITVSINRTNIELLNSGSEERLDFDLENIDILKFLYMAAKKIWKDFTPKPAWSDSSDYYAYYDKRFDSEGGLAIMRGLRSTQLVIDKPCGSEKVCYRFNKTRCETFIYDVIKLVPKWELENE
ncbi:hypothetical protein [Liquorilactobacillus nagelii]|jgi:hypothetical protein|uniref:hypothetical protein n=1 Tax=Liquorilactobacillus nagelii TaxID=82688 RepID=UPI000710244A|nr:hypothetical protein [Liquorilactobacillus nagelii]QYH53679.1 hypothetical protein G6O73_02775 [Liquorilactobacillus nagelii DSM 13675]